MFRRASSLDSDVAVVDRTIDDIIKHRFLEPFPIDNDEGNGLAFNNVCLPEELVTKILTLVGPSGILQKALVCKRWCNIITSTHYWVKIYAREHHKIPKSFPWYVFYCYFCQRLLNCNLLKNGSGEEDRVHWSITDGVFKVEIHSYLGTDPIPSNDPDFNGRPQCFVTNSEKCIKRQSVSLFQSKLLFNIVNRYCPDIYLSDWIAVRPDCSGKYSLEGILHQKGQARLSAKAMHEVALGEGRVWKKIEVVLPRYADYIIDKITFKRKVVNECNSNERYGFKMAGGVIKILMDSINVEGPN